MSKEICFIINPISGTGKWKGIEKSINAHLDKSFNPHIIHTEYAGHATVLAKEAAEKCSVVVAVGGDGMMNEVAQGLLGTAAMLGIIPTGSGNALARHLHIPMSHKGAIECINHMHSAVLDSATMNGKPFFAVCGTGYDAEIANKFAQSSTRGFFTYIYLSVTNFFSYKPAQYEILVDGKTYRERAFLISVANGSQYGNNAYIAPAASAQDGILDVCILKPFSVFISPILGYRLFAKSLNRSSYMKTIKGKRIEIRNRDAHTQLCIHYDGEAAGYADKITIEVKAATTRVIVPQNGTV